MNSSLAILVLVIGGEMNLHACATESGDGIKPKIAVYVDARLNESSRIPAERRATLEQLARYVHECRAAGKPAKLTFVCTHNSRRSQMAQLWAAAAAARFGVDGVETYSGGTERTAFNPRAVAALERAGFEFRADGDAPGSPEVGAPNAAPRNIRYKVTYAAKVAPAVCFSKEYDAPANPNAGFCAVMTCSEADKGCPIVRGAAQRLAIAYDDPKSADGNPDEAARYDERCAQIAREMLFVFSRVRERPR